MRGRRRGNEREVTQESTFSDEVTNLNFELVSLCFPPRWPDTLFQFGFFFNIRIKQSAMKQKKNTFKGFSFYLKAIYVYAVTTVSCCHGEY